MLNDPQFRFSVPHGSGLYKAFGRFLLCSEGAITSSFVLLSSAAITVTTATVITVSGGAEDQGVKISDTLVQIEPGQVLNLDEPPYNFPADENGEESNGEPTVLPTEAFEPERSNPNGDSDGSSVAGGGSSTGGSGSTGAQGGSGVLMGGGLTTEADEDEDNTAGARS